MKRWKTFVPGVLAAVLLMVPASEGVQAQNRFGGRVELDRTVHDFGDIQTTQGPVSCSYTVRNISNGPLTILNVLSSCGCTDVQWTRESIPAGGTGTISATFKNEDGPYPFDKTLTAYFSDVKQPVVLHLRGIAHEKALPVGEMYPLHFGALGMRSAEIKAGNVVQGQQKSGEVKIANIGKVPARITFKDVDEGLKISVTPETIPAGGTATLTYTITPDRQHWGKTWYYVTPAVNGSASKAVQTIVSESRPERGAEAIVSDPNPEIGPGQERIGVWAVIKEDFSALTREQRAAAANPMFQSSTYTFGRIKAGTKVEAVFEGSNIGKSELVIYKADSDSRRLNATQLPRIKAGGKGTVKATLDTKGMPSGEVLIILTLTTNSPLRPIVNLYITGFIQ
ncbi:MAG: DUF1573 domain-containing protein [Bacteroidales bacterium]|nr:DUF1573 domain-containing protein [Bacteroidales bacterium]